MSEIERKQKILNEIMAEAKIIDPKKRNDEFTVNDFCRMTGTGKDMARKLLQQKVNDGLLVTRETSKGVYYSVV
jgi:hypothetical protein